VKSHTKLVKVSVLPYSLRFKGDSHISCRSHAVPMPFRWGFGLCLSHLIYTVRPCLIHTCHATNMPLWKRPLKANAGSRQGNGMVYLCELASAVQRRHVGDLPAFGTLGEWQGNGRFAAWERYGVCESAVMCPIRRNGLVRYEVRLIKWLTIQHSTFRKVTSRYWKLTLGVY
jgi:hypothetical protein